MTGLYKPQLEWLNLEWHRAMISSASVCAQLCEGCSQWRVPPRRYCPNCWSAASTFEPVSGRGTVVSWSISHRSLDPGWAEVVPFVTLVVELEEGPRVLAATTLSPEKASMGMSVATRVEEAGPDFARIWAELSDR